MGNRLQMGWTIMLMILLVSIIVLLLILLYQQYNYNRRRNRQLEEIHHKLASIISDSPQEKLLLYTTDKQLTTLLSDINTVLEHNQRILGDHKRTEQSIRRMLSNISHDLKTPLTVVLGYIERMNLDTEMSTEERTESLKKVQWKANELMDMIQQFFDLAKLEAGDQPLPLTKVHLNELCRRSILQFYDDMTTQGIQAEIDIPQAPLYAHANEGALDRILDNLISNALRYGSEGKMLGISLRQDEKWLYIEVWDRGKGIHEAYHSRVFERMYTLEDSRNKLYQGSGLGLTITKRLVQNMGGEITLYSRPYDKTVFTVKLKRLNY